MNEQNITRRKEVDLEITDFLWEIVRNWRVIAICLIIGAVLLCGYQYIKDSRNAGTTVDEVVEEYSKTVHEMKDALGAQDLDQVYGAVAIKKQLDEKTAADYGVDVTPRLTVIKTVEPAGRKAGVKVGSVDELIAKLKDEAGVI